MKFQGSKQARIECSECQAKGPTFRTYLYTDDDGNWWQGTPLDDWTTYDESELFEDGTVIGRCPAHPA